MGKINVPVQVKSEPKPTKDTKLGALPPEGLSDVAVNRITDEVFPNHDIDEDVNVMRLKKEFGLNPIGHEYTKQVKDILEWGKQKGMSREDLIREIRKIEMRLGKNDDIPRVRQIHTYIILQEAINDKLNKLISLEK